MWATIAALSYFAIGCFSLGICIYARQDLDGPEILLILAWPLALMVFIGFMVASVVNTVFKKVGKK